MHLKNFSLVETEEGSGKYVLYATYDMLSTNVVVPEDKEQLALTINGRKQNLRRKDFIILADSIGLSDKAADKIIGNIAGLKDKYITMCRASYMPHHMQEALEELITDRVKVLAK